MRLLIVFLAICYVTAYNIALIKLPSLDQWKENRSVNHTFFSGSRPSNLAYGFRSATDLSERLVNEEVMLVSCGPCKPKLSECPWPLFAYNFGKSGRGVDPSKV